MLERYMDANLSCEERAQDLLSRMSLDEKMGQIGCYFAEHEDIETAAPYGIGQVSTLEMRQITSLTEAADWQRRIQQRIMELSPHHIPAIFHMEGLCGAFRQGAASLPSGIGRASSFDPALEEELAGIVARQETAVGITQVLAPVLDISRDSRMGRQGETYGEDPTLAAAMGAAYTKGIQDTVKSGGRHAESAAKHFLGFHASQGAIHGANAEIAERTLEEVYAKPFQAAISEAHLRGIMPCYCVINGEPLSASGRILTGLLRDQMGFDGVTVADYSAISNVHAVQHLYESMTEAGKHCLEAGLDVEQPMRCAYNEELGDWLRTGKADMQALDKAVYRVLCAKFRMGLFEHPYALTGKELEEAFYDEQDHARILQSARESLVLLKNDGTLPIRKEVRRIAVIGPHAANARSLFGGYTHLSMEEAVHAVANSLAGVDADKPQGPAAYRKVPGTQIQSDETEEFDAILEQLKPDCRSLLEGLRAAMPEVEIQYAYGYPIAGDDTSHYEEALACIREADLAILTLGGKHGSCSVASMGEGVDGTNINLPVCQDSFIEAAAALGKPLVGVHFNGRPISSDIADQYLSAIVEAWNPAEMGAEAIADVLTGAYNPNGKLPVTVAYHAGQLPIYYNHLNGSSWHQGESIGFQGYVDLPHTPRYHYGHGLSYTTFAYRNLEILPGTPELPEAPGENPAEVRPDQIVSVSMELENTGAVAGTEVVQLYLRDRYAGMARPAMELAGFVRIDLQPGETKRVLFEIRPSQMAFLDENMRWKVEAGDIDVLIGSSSADIRLQGCYRVMDDAWMDGRTRGFYALGREDKNTGL